MLQFLKGGHERKTLEKSHFSDKLESGILDLYLLRTEEEEREQMSLGSQGRWEIKSSRWNQASPDRHLSLPWMPVSLEHGPYPKQGALSNSKDQPHPLGQELLPGLIHHCEGQLESD